MATLLAASVVVLIVFSSVVGITFLAILWYKLALWMCHFLDLY